MHGDKEIGIGTVGDIRTLIERDEDIRLAGIDDSYLREILLHILTEAQGNGKIDILFLGYGSERSGIMTTINRLLAANAVMTNIHIKAHISVTFLHILSDDFAKLLLYYQKT
jgi:hypothetical protein